MDLKEARDSNLKSITIDHWYYSSKYHILKKYVADHFSSLDNVCIVDIGCGSGIFLNQLAVDFSNSTWTFLGIDPFLDEEPAVSDSRISYHKSIPADATPSLTIMMDVIEHIDDDVNFLRQEVISRASSQPYASRVFITVPAFQWLWSSHDDYLEHKRRYTIKSLSAALLESGISIHKTYYFYAALLPLAVPIRLLQGILGNRGSTMKASTGLRNQFYKLVMSLEAVIARYNRIGGLTVVSEGLVAQINQSQMPFLRKHS